MNKPKVSILVPCYNVEKYIRQCSDDFIEPDMFEKLYTAAIDLFEKRLLRRVKKLAYHPTLYMIGYYFKKFKNLYLGENNAT